MRWYSQSACRAAPRTDFEESASDASSSATARERIDDVEAAQRLGRTGANRFRGVLAERIR